MSPKQLLAYFDRIAEAPGAVSRLRRFILDLAVRGKLVEQDPSDEPAPLPSGSASGLAHNEGDIGVTNNRKGASESNGFQLPSSWIWADLQSKCLSVTDGDHLPPPKTDTGIPFLVIGNIRARRLDFNQCRYVSEDYYASLDPRRQPKRGDACTRSSGRSVFQSIVTDDRLFCVQRHIGILRPSQRVDVRYLAQALESDFVFSQSSAIATGIAQKTNPLSGLRRLRIPLPPLTEQRRIVAKVDELMSLCDPLESAQAERERQRRRTLTAFYRRLVRIVSAPAIKSIRDVSFDRFLKVANRREDIADLRQAIVETGLTGGFSRNSGWPTTPSALREFISLQNGYAFESEWFVKSGVRLLRNVNVAHGVVRWDQTVRVTEERASEFERFELSEGDIVFSLDRPFIATGVKVARLSATDVPSLLLQRVGRVLFKGTHLTPEYLLLWMQSTDFVRQMDAGRSNGVPHVSSKQVEAAVLTVPDATEQRRVVTRIRELLRICDRLEARLVTTEAETERLMEAVLRRALLSASHQSADLGRMPAAHA